MCVWHEQVLEHVSEEREYLGLKRVTNQRECISDAFTRLEIIDFSVETTYVVKVQTRPCYVRMPDHSQQHSSALTQYSRIDYSTSLSL